MSGDAQPNSKQRATNEPPPPPSPEKRVQLGTLCVVCGDRACSHLYYGVAACHGCKCFFWRTVKSRLTYACRYGGKCSISTTGRNACRFCRFNRCIDAGMKIEAVKTDKKTSVARKRKDCDVDSMNDDEHQFDLDEPVSKRARSDTRLLVSSLLLIDKTSSDGNAKTPPCQFIELSLKSLFEEPELLDGYRTEMSYRATREADEESCNDSERRLVTWAIDWCRQTADIEDDAIQTADKIALLRACCAPLALLELGQRFCASTFDSRVPLCNNAFLCSDRPPPATSFINWKTLESLVKWTRRELKPLGLTPKEIVLLKALIVLNPDAAGLSADGESAVRALRERINAALFQLAASSMDACAAASRLASILLLIPQITLMGIDIIEQVRVRNTFARLNDAQGLLLWQLYGDIFDESHSDDIYLEHSASCSPTDSQYSINSR